MVSRPAGSLCPGSLQGVVLAIVVTTPAFGAERAPAPQATPQSARGAGPTDATLGPVVWQGSLDGLARPHQRTAFRLSPRGDAFLWFQGPPLPRLMLQPLAGGEGSGGAARMVGTATPCSTMAPRWGPDGRDLYFTAASAPVSARPSGRGRVRTPVALWVVRAALPTLAVEPVWPRAGRADGSIAVLLDVHPSGDRVLVGTARAPERFGGDPRRADLRLALVEVPVGEGAGDVRTLGLFIGGRALARYDRSGAAVELVDGDAGDPGALVRRWDLTRGRFEPGGAERAGWRRHGGDLDVVVLQVPHRGSFGHDPFRTFALARAGSPSAASLRVPAAVLQASIVPPVPIAARAGRVLLCGGLPDRPRVFVTRLFLPAAGATRSARFDPAAALRLSEAFFAGEMLCRVDDGTRPIVERLRATLREPDAPPIRALRARVRWEGIGVNAGTVHALRIVESAPGRCRIERSLAVIEADVSTAEDGDAVGPPPRKSGTQVLSFDGERCWLKGEGDRWQRVDAAFAAAELSSSSLLRLALDPAGLGDPHLAFGPAREESADAQGRRWTLPVRYDDGYAGELVVAETDSGAVLPVAWRSPLHLPTWRLRTQIGRVPNVKTLTFGAWQRRPGSAPGGTPGSASRLVPTRFDFDNGYGSFRLTIEALELVATEEEAGLSRKSFVPQGTGGE